METIAMLKVDLSLLVALNSRCSYKLAELQDLAREQNVAKHWNKPIIEKGWEGKPKGLKQMLWEQGFIDESIPLDGYTIQPSNDGDKEDAESYSLLFLLSTSLDFAAEETALQHVGCKIGVLVSITPKFHAEIAGEGIEYSWGVAKGVYRREPLESKKQGKEKFHALVKKCVCSVNVLHVKQVRTLSRRARAYICAYYFIELNAVNNNQVDNDNVVLSLPQIESLMKEFKTHRSALDFDRTFVSAEVHEIDEEEEGKSNE